MKRFLATLLFPCLILLAVSGPAFSAAGDPETPNALAGGKVISVEEAQALLGKAKFFDLRKAVNVGKGRVPGADILSVESSAPKSAAFDMSLVKLPADKLPASKNDPVVFYSDGPTGWKSYHAAAAAIHAGYTKVNWMRGGISEWSAKGFKIE